MDKDYLSGIKEKYSLPALVQHIAQWQNLKVLVIGDTIIDEYCFVDVKGRAMKDPMLSVNFAYKEQYAGGVLAIANHVSNFVKDVTLVTVIGKNKKWKDFITSRLNKNITPHFFEKVNSPTTRKRRYINGLRNEKLFKVEYMNDKPISAELEHQLVQLLAEQCAVHDIVIVGDFGHGFLNNKLVSVLEQKAKFLAVNAQTNSANLGFNYVTKYNTPHFVSMDGTELKFAVGEQSEDYSELSQKLYARKKFENFLVTLGKDGVVYLQQGKATTSPALATKVTDVVGAGDAVFSVASLLAYTNSAPELVGFISNCIGAIKVSKIGNKESITKSMLLEFIENLYKQIDEYDIEEYFSAVNSTLKNLKKEDITAFVHLLLETYHQGNTVYIFGNGGSAATASHFCGDLIKGVSFGLERRFKAVCLNDNVPSMMSIANDSSYDDIFVEQLKNFLNSNDLVIGISGSGNSANVVKALEYAKSKHARTVALCGYKGGKIKEIADISIHSPIEDMEISEDVHNLVIVHCVKRMLSKELKNTATGKAYEARIQ
ncbi:SIS domain-containing protein [Candidatus Woesearchaeota archaeon]|nr:SIS domain-containing protein [Candidatus Woesearchaeota archaeon]